MVAGNKTCWLELSITPSNRTLLPPKTLNDINYAQNNLPPIYYMQAACDFRAGFLDYLNNWAVPGCCPTCECGGDVSFSTATIPPQPVQVLPNPLVPNLTCSQIYPVSEQVPTLGGGTLNRQFGTYLCFLPFLDMALAEESIDSRYEQCSLFNAQVRCILTTD
jgi:hypothetical protein